MTGKKSFVMLFTILLVSFALMVFIAGTEPHTSQVSTNPVGDDPSHSSEDATNELKHLTAVIAVSPDEFSMIQQLTKTLQGQKAELRVHIENKESDTLYEWLKTAVLSGDAPDIMLLDNEWVYEFASSGMLLPVDEIFKREEHAEHVSQVMAQLRWNGYTWGVPKEVDPYVLVWNPKDIQEMDLPAPETIPFVLNVIERSHLEERIGIYTNIEDMHGLVSLYSLLIESSGESFTERDAFNLEDSAGNNLDELHIEDRWTDVVGRWEAERDLLNENPWQALKDAKLSMMIAPFSEYRKQADGILEFIPLQTLNDGDDARSYTGLLKGKSFAISAGTMYKNEALEWITYMTTETAQLQMLQAGSSIPVRSHTSQLDAFLHFPYNGKLWDAIEHGMTFPPHPLLPEMTRSLPKLEDFSQMNAEMIRNFLNAVNQWTAEDVQ